MILPDLNAGCSMADMADIDQVEECWDALAAVTDITKVVPVTYMNSSAALKAFVGEHGGAVCTSSNARAVLEWALAKGEPGRDPIKVLFFPDQHLGRNTAYDMGYDEDAMRVWNPRFELGGLEERDLKEATFFLWKGHCSVHQRFRPEHVAAFRDAVPRRARWSCTRSARTTWCELADKVGSTERILAWVEQAAPGSVLGVGTEIHMVQRMAREHPDVTVVSLDPLICPCSTMFRIDGPHLAWVLESLVRGDVVNQITVDEHTTEWARVALERMLEIT